MKKNTILFKLAAVILCGLTTPAVAADFCGQNYNDCCTWDICDGKVTLGADWLYWKVQQDGLLPVVGIGAQTSETSLAVQTRRTRPSSNWDNGFRVNLGYELPCDGWDANLNYTYMPANASSRTIIVENNFTVAPIAGLEAFAPLLAEGQIATIGNKWNITVNNIDLDIGRNVSFGECLTVRPHVGFRATWFDQKQRIALGFTPALNVEVAGTLLLKEKFQGYGVEAGLWTDYKLGCGLSLVGHFGGSILYSKFNVSRSAAAITIDTSGTDPVQTFALAIRDSESFCSATPSVDYYVGLQYADTLCDMLFRARLGWEQHVFFDTNRFLTSGNLTGQGLTLGLDVGF